MKYKFTERTKEYQNITLHEIEAVRDFGNIKKGTVGGWIEKESNLSHEGECWVAGNALVCGDAQVYGDAQVFGEAWVYGNAEVWGNAQVFGNALVYGSILGKKNQVLPEELSTLPECIEEVTIRGEKYKKVTKWEKVSE
jgi:carbonic anhydrase/acetyltransferase-like protein (isoleucine patch superfamily)